MHTFHIRASSWVLSMVTFLTIWLAGIYFLLLLPNQTESPVVVIMIILAILSLAIYITRFTSQAKTKWTVTDKQIDLVWVSQFIFLRKPNLTIHWADIQEYKFQPDRNFDFFHILLKDGITVNLCHSTFQTKDDFEKFIRYFEKEIGIRNSSGSAVNIRRSKNFYETKGGLLFAIFIAFWMIAIPFFGLFSHRGNINWAGLGVGYSGGIYYILQVIAHRKNLKNELESGN